MLKIQNYISKSIEEKNTPDQNKKKIKKKHFTFNPGFKLLKPVLYIRYI